MSKRIVCALLTLVLLIGILPAAALRVSAAGTVSEKLVTQVTQQVPFKSEAYEVVKKSGEYFIGYGTPAKKGQKGMTTAEAKNVLREYLNGLAAKINNDYGTYSQQKIDALASYSFHNGLGWMTKGALKNTLAKTYTEEDILKAFCATSIPTAEQLKIRLTEVNLFINGVYSTTPPSNYAFVILDPNGGTSDKSGMVQGYLRNSSATIDAAFDPKLADNTFVGWYTHKKGGKYVTTLDASTNGQTLYAHWQKNGSGVDKNGNIVGIKVSYMIPAYMSSSYDSKHRIIVYKSPDVATQVGTVDSTDFLNVVAEHVYKGEKWVRIQDSGWVNLGKTPSPVEPGVVNLGDKMRLDIHENVAGKNPGQGGIIGAVRNGDRVTVIERRTVNGTEWGLTVFLDATTNSYMTGWIKMAFVNLSGTATGGEGFNNGAIATGVINHFKEVNVRKEADIYSPVIDHVQPKEKVNIYKKVTHDNMLWAKTDKGWVSMTYITEDIPASGGAEGSTNKGTPIAFGIVNSRIDLNVRVDAGTEHTKISALRTGTKIPIYEKKTVRGAPWGRTDLGWVCLTYVTESAAGPDGKPDTTGAQKGRVNSPIGVNIRTGAGVHNAPVGRAPYNSEVTVYEIVDYNGTKWGRIDGGYSCMDYIDLLGPVNPDAGGSGSTTGARTGSIVGTKEVNVRKGPGVKNPEVMKLKKGTRVTVYETTMVDKAEWGRIDQGWVSMQYVQLDGGAANPGGGIANPGAGGSGTPGGNAPAISKNATGYVNSTVNLTLRSGPGLEHKEIGSLAPGTRVNIYEQTFSGGMMWVKIDQGWVYMGYITVDSTGSTGKGKMGIANCNRTLKVRSAPGTGSAWISNIETNAPVEILEQKEHSGEMWGRTSVGWVSMKYITLNADLPTPPIPGGGATPPTTPAQPDQKPSDNSGVFYEISGTMAKSSPLRMIPNKMGDYSVSLDAGDEVKISKLENADGILWGYVEGGWINVANVSFNVYAVANKAQLVWQEANTNRAIDTLNKGETVNIYDLKLDENKKVWANIGYGWIELTNVTEPESYTPTFMVKGTAAKDGVPIRLTPSKDGELAGNNLNTGDSIVIVGMQFDSDGNLWAKSNKGWWINMANVNVDSLQSVIARNLIVWGDKDQTVGNAVAVLNLEEKVAITEITLNIYGKPVGYFVSGATSGWVELGGLTEIA